MTPNFSRYTQNEQLKTLSDTVLLRSQCRSPVWSPPGRCRTSRSVASGIASGPGNVELRDRRQAGLQG